MNIIHLSTECYPAAKVGGLADVVGALPKYLNQNGMEAWVLIPEYDLPWFASQSFTEVHHGKLHLGASEYEFQIFREEDDVLGFPFYFARIPGLTGRDSVYLDPMTKHGFADEFERNLAFQLAALHWIQSFENLPDVVHCHDHHTALVPFLMTKAHIFDRLSGIPTVLTIHNGEYQGSYDMGKRFLLPGFDWHDAGYLEWNHRLNTLASGVRSAWKVTTVSPNYMNELISYSSGLEQLLRSEKEKCQGIVNGIDSEVWNPSTDPMIKHHYSFEDFEEEKARNKHELNEDFHLQNDLPLVVYIGRFAKEKGADLIPDLFLHAAYHGVLFNFIVLGTGDTELVSRFQHIRSAHFGFFNAKFEYNEPLAHRIYAGADFLLMPSRVEPCGLNQMYAMRYGTIPIVRATGGLYDTVVDMDQPDGYGIQFWNFSIEDATCALRRASDLYNDEQRFRNVQRKIMQLDFSWNQSASKYQKIYQSLLS